MTPGFDPAAATAAYLATISPAAHAKALAYTHGGYWLLLWDAVASVAAAWIVLRTGVLVRLRARLEQRRPRPFLVVFAVLAVFLLADFVLELPWNAYAHWWRERQYGMTSQALGGWLTEQAVGLGVGLVMLTVLMEALYLLIRRAPRSWWLWGTGVTAIFILGVFVLQPLYIEPLYNTYRPAPPGPVRDAVVQIAVASHIPPDKIYVYNGSKQSNRYTANAAGLFGTARIAMSDTMFREGVDVAEVKAVVGHEVGHYVMQHALRDSALLAALALVGFVLTDRLFPWVARVAGAQGVRGIADPAGYPVLVILVAVLGLLATPLVNAITRAAESEADTYSLQHVNEPDGFARALMKTVAYRAATPGPLEEAIFYNHPSVGSRLRKAMDWKAAHPAPPSAPPAASAAPAG
ncbi:MAG: M48 family metalloprotease [Caulobacterales bacterium]|nr:M48 family metalloprotease [Caulobacterales bacterium]